jgi:predicted ATPase with chaperone activity
MRKEGASFDLLIALGILGTNGDLGEAEGLTDLLALGELLLPVALRARDAGIRSPLAAGGERG